MTRIPSAAGVLAVSALLLPSAAAAAPPPPGNSSCMATISYGHGTTGERDDYAQSVIESRDAPGRDFYRYNATRTTEECD